MSEQRNPDEPLPTLVTGSPVHTYLEQAALRAKETGVHLGQSGYRAHKFFAQLQEEYARSGDREQSRSALLLRLAHQASRLREVAFYKMTDFDPVLLYCVAVAEGLDDVAQEHAEAAFRHYLGDQEPYDRALGELIPDGLRRRARWVTANTAYDSSANATALGDWQVFRARHAALEGQPRRGVTTGLAALDRALLGLRGLTLLGGPTGSGKSVLALNVAAAALRGHADLAALYILLDPGMTREMMYERLLCSAARLDSRSLCGPRSEAVRKALDAADQDLAAAVLPRLKVLALRPGVHAVDADAVVGHRDALAAATGVERVLVIVDYLSFIDVPDGVASTSLEADQARVEAVQEARRRSRSASQGTGDPYLVICEVVKSRDGEVPLTGAHLLGSTRLQYAADNILLLQPGPQPADPEAPAPVTLRVDKCRDGVRADIPLAFDHVRSTFREKGVARGGVPPRRSPAAAVNPAAGLEEA